MVGDIVFHHYGLVVVITAVGVGTYFLFSHNRCHCESEEPGVVLECGSGAAVISLITGSQNPPGY